MGDETNSHHILPTSRGGEDKDNIVTWDEDFHDYYHRVASNLTLQELHVFLEIISTPKERWTSKDIHRLRQQLKNNSISQVIQEYE